MIKDRIKSLRRVKASDLKPNPRNWREHPEAQRAALSGVLAEIGYADACLARELPDGSLELVDGHLRADLDPDEKLPTLILDITESEADKLLTVLDPLAGMAEANEEALGKLLAEIETDNEGLAAMLEELAAENGLEEPAAEIEEVEPQIDRAAELQKKWKTETGQLWVIPSVKGKGEHRVLCGDSTKAEDVERVMGGQRAEIVLADPPYGVAWNTDPNRSRGGPGFAPIIGDNKPFDPSPWVSDRPTILWGGNHYASRLPDSAAWIIWDKRPSGYSNDQADCEIAWSNLPGPSRLFRYAWSGGGTLAKENGAEQRSLHPTQKPVSLMAWCIEKADVEGVVYDPFLGSGTTTIAAEQLGRLAYGLEISPAYVAVILERLTDLGLTPGLSK